MQVVKHIFVFLLFSSVAFADFIFLKQDKQTFKVPDTIKELNKVGITDNNGNTVSLSNKIINDIYASVQVVEEMQNYDDYKEYISTLQKNSQAVKNMVKVNTGVDITTKVAATVGSMAVGAPVTAGGLIVSGVQVGIKSGTESYIAEQVAVLNDYAINKISLASSKDRIITTQINNKTAIDIDDIQDYKTLLLDQQKLIQSAVKISEIINTNDKDKSFLANYGNNLKDAAKNYTFAFTGGVAAGGAGIFVNTLDTLATLGYSIGQVNEMLENDPSKIAEILIKNEVDSIKSNFSNSGELIYIDSGFVSSSKWYKEEQQALTEQRKQELAQKEAEQAKLAQQKKETEEKLSNLNATTKKAEEQLNNKRNERDKIANELSKNANSLSGAKELRDYWDDEVDKLKDKIKLVQKGKDSALKKWNEAEANAEKFKGTAFEKRWRDDAEKYKNSYWYNAKKLQGYSDDLKKSESEYKKANTLYKDIKTTQKKLEADKKAVADAIKKIETEKKKVEEEIIASQKIQNNDLDFNTFDDELFGVDLIEKPEFTPLPRFIEVDSENEIEKQNDVIESDMPSGNQNNQSSNNLIAGKFKITPIKFASQKFKSIAHVPFYMFGDNYEMADWTDVENAYGEEFLSDIGYVNGASEPTYRVYNNGAESTGGTADGYDRVYYISYHNHNKPGNYLAHDHINNYDISLGSWYGSRAILTKNTDTSIQDRPTDYGYTGPTDQKINWTGRVALYVNSGVAVTHDLTLESDPQNSSISNTNIGTVVESYYANKNNFAVVIDHANGSGVNSWAISSPSEEVTQYEFTTWGNWNNEVYNDVANSSHIDSRFIIGQQTPGGSVPTSGTATYSGKVEGILRNGVGAFEYGSGDLSLQANFGTRALMGTFNNMKANGNAWHDMNVNAAWNANSSEIQGTLSGNGMNGAVNGKFFGPNAEEIGGSWTANGNGYEAVGTFRGKQ